MDFGGWKPIHGLVQGESEDGHSQPEARSLQEDTAQVNHIISISQESRDFIRKMFES